jgi:hypothetical protein
VYCAVSDEEINRSKTNKDRTALFFEKYNFMLIHYRLYKKSIID